VKNGLGLETKNLNSSYKGSYAETIIAKGPHPDILNGLVNQLIFDHCALTVFFLDPSHHPHR
jgi:hypothetical protein